jgi:hypothetical protein
VSVVSPAGFEEAVSGADGGTTGCDGSGSEMKIAIGNFPSYTDWPSADHPDSLAMSQKEIDPGHPEGLSKTTPRSAWEPSNLKEGKHVPTLRLMCAKNALSCL